MLPQLKYYCRPYNAKSSTNPCPGRKKMLLDSRLKCIGCPGVERLKSKKIATKKCTGCEKELPFSNFNRDKSKPDGVSTRCIQCRKTSLEAKRAERQDHADLLIAVEGHCILCRRFKKKHGFTECKDCVCHLKPWSPFKNESG